MSVERIMREELDTLVSKVQEGRQKNAKSGKIALISDVHSNYWALKSVLEDISQSGAEDIFCAGDVVGYGPRPNECCYLLRALQVPTVMGNHDYGVLNKDFDYIGGIGGKLARDFTDCIINEGNREWLYWLPVELEGSVHGNGGIYMVHGSPSDPLKERVFPDISNEDLNYYFDNLDINVLITGHTHHPFTKRVINGKEVKTAINPGSVGQPRPSRELGEELRMALPTHRWAQFAIVRGRDVVADERELEITLRWVPYKQNQESGETMV